MRAHEYKVVPAPAKPAKVRGAKSPEARFAATLEAALNAAAEDGWEFLRAETLPVEERTGLTGTRSTFRSVLVYRRALDEAPPDTGDEAEGPRLLEDRGGAAD